MNVVLALLIVALFAAVGGVGYGVLTYGGAILPKKEVQKVNVGPKDNQKEIEVSLWLPGIIGHGFVGLLSGLTIFCVYSAPSVVVTTNDSFNLTFYMLGSALLAGLGGSTAINELVEKRQWAKLAPVLENSDPSEKASATGGKPVEVLRMLAVRR
jgi:hypothetical protein